jgi:hypothetical protein
VVIVADDGIISLQPPLEGLISHVPGGAVLAEESTVTVTGNLVTITPPPEEGV